MQLCFVDVPDFERNFNFRLLITFASFPSLQSSQEYQLPYYYLRYEPLTCELEAHQNLRTDAGTSRTNKPNFYVGKLVE
jgi:hypothetical protein